MASVSHRQRGLYFRPLRALRSCPEGIEPRRCSRTAGTSTLRTSHQRKAQSTEHRAQSTEHRAQIYTLKIFKPKKSRSMTGFFIQRLLETKLLCGSCAVSAVLIRHLFHRQLDASTINVQHDNFDVLTFRQMISNLLNSLIRDL